MHAPDKSGNHAKAVKEAHVTFQLGFPAQQVERSFPLGPLLPHRIGGGGGWGRRAPPCARLIGHTNRLHFRSASTNLVRNRVLASPGEEVSYFGILGRGSIL
jgi:hypothetical protein